MTAPNTFIVGAPKCGTTSLSRYLGAHPNVFMSEPKEPSFFCEDFPNTREVRTVDAYERLFAEANEEHAVVAEASTWYLHSEVAIPRILEYQPNARLIAMVRNPVEMVYSLHAQFRFNRIEDVDEFERAWEIQDERPDRRFLQYGEVGRLGTQVARLLETASAEQVKIVVFDDFVEDTEGTYREVLDFLGVPHDGRTEFPAYNRSKEHRNRRLAAFLHETPAWFTASLRAVKRVLGVQRIGLSAMLERLNIRRRSRPELPSRTRRRVVRHFAPEVERLSDLLDRDLSHWTTLEAG